MVGGSGVGSQWTGRVPYFRAGAQKALARRIPTKAASHYRDWRWSIRGASSHRGSSGPAPPVVTGMWPASLPEQIAVATDPAAQEGGV